MRLPRILVLACAALLCAAGIAYADATIYAGPPSQFVGGDVTIAQGEMVTFTNGDTLAHDVTASKKGDDGKPLFASEQIGPAQSAPVAGVEFLTTGAYEYICSLHPYMKGTITVSGEGTPKPRPGGGGGGGGGGSDRQTNQGDATYTGPPQVTVKVLDTKRSKVRKRKSLQLSFTTNAPVRVAATARSGKTVLARGAFKVNKAGTRKLSVKLTKAGLRAAKGRKPVSVAVEVVAKDSNGETSRASASGRLR